MLCNLIGQLVELHQLPGLKEMPFDTEFLPGPTHCCAQSRPRQSDFEHALDSTFFLYISGLNTTFKIGFVLETSRCRTQMTDHLSEHLVSLICISHLTLRHCSSDDLAKIFFGNGV